MLLEDLPLFRHQVFEEHLRLCPECVHYVETYRLTVRISRLACEVREEPCGQPPERLVRAILAAFRKEGRTE